MLVVGTAFLLTALSGAAALFDGEPAATTEASPSETGPPSETSRAGDDTTSRAGNDTTSRAGNDTGVTSTPPDAAESTRDAPTEPPAPPAGETQRLAAQQTLPYFNDTVRVTIDGFDQDSEDLYGQVVLTGRDATADLDYFGPGDRATLEGGGVTYLVEVLDVGRESDGGPHFTDIRVTAAG